MIELFLFTIAIILIVFGANLWGLYNTLVPLRNRVTQKKADLEGVQQRALLIADAFALEIFAYQTHEGDLLRRYINAVERAASAGATGAILINIIQGIAPPDIKSAGLYRDKMTELGSLGREHQRKLEEYNAAVAELNNRKETFPANLFDDYFFNIPRAIFLTGKELQLLPPVSLAAHLQGLQRLNAKA